MLGRPSACRRRLIDGIRWRVRTGAPWRDLPAEYGPWQTRSMGSFAAGTAMVSGQRC
ncbi:transposase [Streptomyces sp. NPDC058206]|uniref:transposase n=1 Tax=Streptomyces sp. NPDC058206 TaxID=3346382 RepID=UPI0036EDAD03